MQKFPSMRCACYGHARGFGLSTYTTPPPSSDPSSSCQTWFAPTPTSAQRPTAHLQNNMKYTQALVLLPLALAMPTIHNGDNIEITVQLSSAGTPHKDANSIFVNQAAGLGKEYPPCDSTCPKDVSRLPPNQPPPVYYARPTNNHPSSVLRRSLRDQGLLPTCFPTALPPVLPQYNPAILTPRPKTRHTNATTPASPLSPSSKSPVSRKNIHPATPVVLRT